MERAPDRDDDVETIRSDEPPDDTSGGPLSSGAGEGSGQDAPDAPDVNVPGGADDSGDATEGDTGGG
jgi:hypothetical protein